ncbi:MAG: hypothetical protein HFF17_09660 [Oscillospiraceae bacterium]|nr:hypothetical protein [Oscillospiraceae bacterium]
MKQKDWIWRTLAVLFLISTILFGSLWLQERRECADLRALAEYHARDAGERFQAYLAHGEESDYWYGVAALRGFEQAYLAWKGAADSNYTFCNEVYGALVLAPAQGQDQAAELGEILALLAEDAADRNAFVRLDALRHTLRS